MINTWIDRISELCSDSELKRSLPLSQSQFSHEEITEYVPVDTNSSMLEQRYLIENTIDWGET